MYLIMRKDILQKEQEIRSWVNDNESKASICNRLHCNKATLERYLKILGIEYRGNQGCKGKRKDIHQYIPLVEYLSKSKSIQSNKIRIKLIREGYKSQKCESCGLSEWQGKPIPLELHHIDGNHHNNVIENFQLLCPNCHAMTEFYRGRNIK